MDFGYVIKRSEDDFVINVNLNDYYSGYNVVPKEIDPFNQYDINEVRAYCKANPLMVYAEHPLEYQKNLLIEMRRLKQYLAETDYMVVKCSERGLSMASEYPEDYAKRQKARDRINEISEILGRILGGNK